MLLIIFWLCFVSQAHSFNSGEHTCTFNVSEEEETIGYRCCRNNNNTTECKNSCATNCPTDFYCCFPYNTPVAENTPASNDTPDRLWLGVVLRVIFCSMWAGVATIGVFLHRKKVKNMIEMAGDKNKHLSTTSVK